MSLAEALGPICSSAGLSRSDFGPRPWSSSLVTLPNRTCLQLYERRESLVVLPSLLLERPEGAHPSKFVYIGYCCCHQLGADARTCCQPIAHSDLLPTLAASDRRVSGWVSGYCWGFRITLKFLALQCLQSHPIADSSPRWRSTEWSPSAPMRIPNRRAHRRPFQIPLYVSLPDWWYRTKAWEAWIGSTSWVHNLYRSMQRSCLYSFDDEPSTQDSDSISHLWLRDSNAYLCLSFSIFLARWS